MKKLSNAFLYLDIKDYKKYILIDNSLVTELVRVVKQPDEEYPRGGIGYVLWDHVKFNGCTYIGRNMAISGFSIIDGDDNISNLVKRNYKMF